MDFAELKPILTALALPPAGPLLLVLLGLLVWKRAVGPMFVWLGAGALWLLSCNALAVLLSQTMLPQVKPLEGLTAASPEQAIVVLGGGVVPHAAEYRQPQPSAETLARLRYGVYLARQSGKPLAFAGGVGWTASGTGAPKESDVAQQVLRQDYGMALRWAEGESRDTHENAQQLRALLQKDKIDRIVLVTHSTHMPRAMLEFQQAGFSVTPAPTGYPVERERALLEWLPSAQGLGASRQVLREWLARQMVALR